MQALRAYIFSVTTAAVLCAILTHICAGGGKQGSIMKLICGLFLAFTVIRPITDIRLDDLEAYPVYFTEDAAIAVSKGEAFAKESLSSLIKQETEAYILDEAIKLGAEISAEVILSEDDQPVPEEVYIKGKISPSVKAKLQTLIAEQLGIAKEYQIWIQ